MKKVRRTKRHSEVFINRSSMQSKRYENPFFRHRKQSTFFRFPKLSMRHWVIVSVGIMAVIALAWSLFYSGYFFIKKIEISGLERVGDQELKMFVQKGLEDRQFFLIPNNLITVNTERIISRLNEIWSFENIEIDKDYPDKLSVRIQEKSYAFIILEDDHYIYVDRNRYLINEVNVLDIQQRSYPLIQNMSDKKIYESRVGIDQEVIDFSLNVYERFQALSEKFVIDRIFLDNDVNSVKIDLRDGPDIYLNSAEDIESQVQRLLIIRDEKLKSDFNTKTYIDLRFGNRAYIR